jgi:polyhydroxyalkanoate synthesis regulator phasin
MSDYIEQLKEIATCGHGWAEERANMALQLTEDRNAGNISADEYRELMEDLVRTDKLDAEATDVEVKSALVYCVVGLSKVI